MFVSLISLTSLASFPQPTKTKGVNTHRAGRSLINPFDPSHVTIKLTSNRRRWIHIFPKGQTHSLQRSHANLATYFGLVFSLLIRSFPTYRIYALKKDII